MRDNLVGKEKTFSNEDSHLYTDDNIDSIYNHNSIVRGRYDKGRRRKIYFKKRIKKVLSSNINDNNIYIRRENINEGNNNSITYSSLHTHSYKSLQYHSHKIPYSFSFSLTRSLSLCSLLFLCVTYATCLCFTFPSLSPSVSTSTKTISPNSL